VSQPEPNEGKNLTIEVDGKSYDRLPVKSHVITENDSIPDAVEKYVTQHLMPGDIIFISEKSVACSQKRAIPVKDIKPSRLATTLSRFVYKSPHGIGLSMPETMEMALRECGAVRILFAAFISAIGKLFRVRGWFYRIAGYKAASIDGPTPYTLPPYNECVVLGPEDPDSVAAEVAGRVGCKACVVDLNDLAGKILGASHKDLDKKLLVRILRDNPLGQGSQQTPFGIIREA